MLDKKLFENILGKQVYDDILWEYDPNLLQVIKKNKTENKINYNLTYTNLKQKYDLMIFLDSDLKGFKGYCNCELGKQGKNCEHLIWGLLSVDADLIKSKREKKEVNSSQFKLDVLKNLGDYNFDIQDIYLSFYINNFSNNKVEFQLKANINKQQDYRITNIEKFVEAIKVKKPLKYGKYFDVQDYNLTNKVKELIMILDYINLSLKIEGSSINVASIDYSLFALILKSYINEYINFKDEEYLINLGINDVNLFVRSNIKTDSIEGAKAREKLVLEFIKQNDYEILSEEIAINHKTKTIHLLDKRDEKKLELLQVMLNNVEDVQTSEDKHKVYLSKDDSAVLIEDILPKIFNEFDVHLDQRLDIDVVSDKLRVEIFCFKEKKDIYIKPKFIYGKYDALEENNGVLIRRNKAQENLVMTFFVKLGYEYDPLEKVFIVSSKRAQFKFLTNDIFEIRESYSINLDEKLKHSILNFDSSSISINIKRNKNYDYFEVNFDIPNIKSDEINNILKAFEDNRTFYKLENDTFLKLNDQKIYEQLMFVKDVIKDNSYKLNSNRIPKYKALQLESEVKNKFVKYDFNQSFLNYIDSIRIIEPLDDSTFSSHDYTLRNYQKVGISWLSNLYEAKLGALLADEMGLGKTLQTISFLQIKNISKALIVVPKALIYNWVSEFEKFAHEFNVVVIDGTRQKREELIGNITDNSIVITNYNTIINDYKLYENIDFNTIIIDEAQYIKNPTSKTARCIKLLKAEFFIALTGTPIENNLLEMWSIFDFILPGYFSDLNSFNKKYKVNKTVSNLQVLKDASAPFVLRRLKKDVLKELPPKQETNVMCEMEEVQKTIYYEYNEKVKKEIDKYITSSEYSKKSIEILSAITKLRQLALTPKLVSNDYSHNSGKIDTFLELIDEIISSNKSVLVFSQYTSLLSILKEKLEEKGIKYYYLDGKTKPKQRLIDVEKFNKNNVPVYLISLKAGGVGLNLTKASTVIIMDPWWNPAVENQAIDRTHRIGQKESVEVYRLISKGSIEEKVLEIKKDKEKLVKDVLEMENEDITTMKQEDLINLLKI